MSPKYKQQIKKITKEEDKHIVHVRLENPLSLRKGLIGSAIDLAKMLNTYSELKQIRSTKEQVMSNFIDIHGDIRKLMRFLEADYLPIIPSGEEIQSRVAKKELLSVAIGKTQKIEIKKEVVTSEVDQLKAELADIERKLKSL